MVTQDFLRILVKLLCNAQSTIVHIIQLNRFPIYWPLRNFGSVMMPYRGDFFFDQQQTYSTSL